MKGPKPRTPTVSAVRNPRAANVQGRLLGHEVTTKAVQPTSAKAVGVAVSALIEPLQNGKRGKAFVPPSLLTAWPTIVGERLAPLCMPIHMKAQPKSRSRHAKTADQGAVLEVRADPAIQIDLEYGQVVMVERINSFFGYQAVSRLKVVASAVKQSSAASRREVSKANHAEPSQQAQESAEKLVAQVADEGLRKALKDLGASVLEARKQRP